MQLALKISLKMYFKNAVTMFTQTIFFHSSSNSAFRLFWWSWGSSTKSSNTSRFSATK